MNVSNDFKFIPVNKPSFQTRVNNWLGMSISSCIKLNCEGGCFILHLYSIFLYFIILWLDSIGMT